MNEQRLIEIETKLAYQEDTLHQLNDALSDQQQQISELKDTCKLLFARLKSLPEELASGTPTDEKPPHY